MKTFSHTSAFHLQFCGLRRESQVLAKSWRLFRYGLRQFTPAKYRLRKRFSASVKKFFTQKINRTSLPLTRQITANPLRNYENHPPIDNLCADGRWPDG
jgi:hypothetical protein